MSGEPRGAPRRSELLLVAHQLGAVLHPSSTRRAVHEQRARAIQQAEMSMRLDREQEGER